MKWRGRVKVGALVAIVALAAASFALPPPKVSGPPHAPFAGAEVNPAVLSILQRSCADCHSDQTDYPWYSYIAPVSLLIRSDVMGGREHLNFSRWAEYSLVRKERALSEIANQVKDGDMPLAQYTWIHRGARLSQSEVDAVFRWTQAERARLIAESARRNSTSPNPQ